MSLNGSCVRRGYCAPVQRANWRGKKTITIYNLQHPEAVEDLLSLLRNLEQGEKAKIEIYAPMAYGI